MNVAIRHINLSNIAIAIALTVLGWPWLQWVAIRWAAGDHFINLMILGFLGFYVHKNRKDILASTSRTPRASAFALICMAAGLAGAIYFSVVWKFYIFGAASFLILVFGFIALVLDYKTLARLSPFFVLAMLILPFQSHLDIYIGFPLRTLIAEVAAKLLTLGQVEATTETIITIENSSAAVDLPCAGIKSLWSLGVFVIIASILSNRRWGGKWLMAACTAVIVLIVMNIARVTALSYLVLFVDARAWADMVHTPLGLIGFTAACITFHLLAPKSPSTGKVVTNRQTTWFEFSKRQSMLVAATLLACGVITNHQNELVATHEITPLPMTHEAFKSIPLEPFEIDFFSRFPGTSAGKVRFKDSSLSGSALILRSQQWRGQHSPEQCFAGWGIEVATWSPFRLGDNFQGRAAMNQKGKIIAIFWFQSPKSTTGDFTERIWRSYQGDRTWTLVSVYLDRPVRQDSQALSSLIRKFSKYVTSIHHASDRQGDSI